MSVVHPRHDVVDGVPAYPSIADVPEPVELAVIAVPSEAVVEVARECGAAGVRALVVLSAGFAEVGARGRARQAELLAVCRAAGMRLVGPNCLGVLNTDPGVAFNATFAPVAPAPGGVAFASQSGAFGIAAVAEATRRGLGLSSFVSTGNKADLSGNDFLRFWETDPATEVIGLYLESFGNPRRFGQIARRVAAHKPVIAVKSGRSAAGSRAASSHTGALLAASDATVDALFRHAGVIRTGTVGELFDVAALLAGQPLPTGNRVAIVTNAGGPGIACADACEAAGLVVEPLPAKSRRRLARHLPREASAANPVDMIASASADDYRRTIEALAEDPSVDAIVAIFIPPLVTQAQDVAGAIRAAAASTRAAGKPLLAVWMAQDDAEMATLAAGSEGVPAYGTPEEAVRALAHAAGYADWRRAREQTWEAPEGIDADAAAAVIAQALTDGGEWLVPDRVAELLAAYGIPQVRATVAATAAAVARWAAAAGGDVAIKAIAPGLIDLAAQTSIEPALTALMKSIACRTLGIYWPIKREIDVRAWANRLSIDTGIELALPAVVERHPPLEYWLWRAGDTMTRGFWDIPVPAKRTSVQPGRSHLTIGWSVWILPARVWRRLLRQDVGSTLSKTNSDRNWL